MLVDHSAVLNYCEPSQVADNGREDRWRNARSSEIWLEKLAFKKTASRCPTRPDEARRGPTRPDEARRGPTRPDEARRGPTRPERCFFSQGIPVNMRHVCKPETELGVSVKEVS